MIANRIRSTRKNFATRDVGFFLKRMIQKPNIDSASIKWLGQALLPAELADIEALYRLGQQHVGQQNHGQEHEVQRRQRLQLEVAS